jgi:hypothetical protein
VCRARRATLALLLELLAGRDALAHAARHVQVTVVDSFLHRLGIATVMPL